MRTTRLITASLATVLGAGVIGAPAIARPLLGCPDVGVPCYAPSRPVDTTVSGSLPDRGPNRPSLRTPRPPRRPIRPPLPKPHVVAAGADAGSGLDWNSAGLGAATVLGAFAIGTAGVAVVRCRRMAGVAPSNH